LQGAVGSLRRTVNAVRNAFAWGQNKINEFDNVLKLVDDLTEQVQEYVDASANIITSSLGIYRRLFSIAKFPGALAKSVMENVVKVMRSVKDTIEFTASLKEILGDDYNQIALCADEAQRIASQIVSYGKRKNTNTDSVAIVGGTPLTVVGTSSHMVTAGDDLTSIASSEYGDPALAELLVLYNGLTDDELVPGTELTIPILVRSVQNQDNALYGWNIQNTLGIDIAIDRSSGDITIVESGDFALVEGKETIIQAINLRLNEVLGRRLRLTTYGLKLVVGGAQDNSVPTSYILANIIDTLKQDPRILSVYNIKLVGQGDALHVAFNIDTIGEAVSYQGVI
jgi:LysM repeat protein